MQIGVNLPWLEGAYGHDLGINQSCPEWPIAFDPAKLDPVLDCFSSFGLTLLRTWICEQGEGLHYNDDHLVTGVDSAFLENLEGLAILLQRRGFLVYWTLLDANAPYRNADFVTLRILTDRSAMEAFCDRVLPAIIPLIRGSAWAIDLCNEPEAIVRGRFGNGTQQGVDWSAVVPNLTLLADRVRALAPGIRISVGSGFTEQVNWRDNRAFFEFGLKLDFLDYHSYKKGSVIAPHTACLNDMTCDMSVVLGELGYQVPAPLRGDHAAWQRGQRELSAKLHRAANLGYKAAFLWFASDMANADATSLFFRYERGQALYTVAELVSLPAPLKAAR
jgi:hypothetical protein